MEEKIMTEIDNGHNHHPELIRSTDDEIYESPDGGETITKRNLGEYEREIISQDAVKFVEDKYPETTKEFRRLQHEQYRVFCEKQMDYGPGNISVGTNLETDEEVKMSLTGLWFRMNDKIQRMKTLLIGSQEANNEPLEDSFLDVSNYGIMSTIVSNKKWGK